MRKLVRALPETFRADAEAASDAVVIDPAGWGERQRPRTPLVDALQEGVVRRRKLRLTYVKRTGDRSERTVDPLGLVDKDETWYLLAGTEKGQRTFRVDRVVDVVLTDVPADRPADFQLPAAWDRVRVRVAAPTPVMIAQQLAGWGGLVQVEQSAEVRAQLARLGAELVDSNAAVAED